MALIRLIPEEPCTVPNYYCTWFVQNYQEFQDGRPFEIGRLMDSDGSALAQKNINEAKLFGTNGWVPTFHPRARQDLYFLMDHGWEQQGFFSLELDTKKFPSFAGQPQERLRELNERIMTAGWRGLGLWVRGDINPKEAQERVSWSKYAGIKYWKIDGGDTGSFNTITAAEKIYPSLVLEHANGNPIFNGYSEAGKMNEDWADCPSKFGKSADIKRILSRTHVFRTYDVSCRLSVPTTIQRTADILTRFGAHGDCTALLNLEDEAILSAVLGCTIGVMRHPQDGLRAGDDADLFINGGRRLKKRMDEIARALRWQSIASPTPVGMGKTLISKERLIDNWHFKMGDTFASWGIGHMVKQGAPAVMARNMELPAVTCEGDRPYVVAGRFDNGAMAVATLGRCHKDNDWYHPRADVIVHVGEHNERIGVFGYYKSLTLIFDRSIEGVRILAQDLLAKEAQDITNRVKIDGTKLLLQGNIIESIGTKAQTKDDLSDPGMVLQAFPGNTSG